MARETRTRLNAELASQYGARRDEATPGRSSLTAEDVEEKDGVEAELEEPEVAARDAEPARAERESQKSIFELPRKEPSRQPLLGSPFSPAPAAPAPAGTPTPDKPKR